MELNQLSGVAVTLVVAAIVIALGLNILGETRTEFVDNTVGCNATYKTGCGEAYNATIDAQEGVGKLSSKLPLIGLAVAAVIVISVIVGAFRTDKA
jgi:hypothetical protein